MAPVLLNVTQSGTRSRWRCAAVMIEAAD